jgi:hypothetical protein
VLAQFLAEAVICRLCTNRRREIDELLVEVLRHLFDEFGLVLRMQPCAGEASTDFGAPVRHHSIVTHSALPRCC